MSGSSPGVAVASVALRSYQTTLAQKRSAWGSYCVIPGRLFYHRQKRGLGDSGGGALAFLPWLEILTRICTLRLPKEKRSRPKTPPSTSLFPALDEISREIENEGFAHVNDAGWDWESTTAIFQIVL